MNLFGSKRGQVQNYTAALVFLILFGFTTIISYLILSEFTDAVTTAGYYTGAAQSVGEQMKSGLRIFDTVTVILMIILVITAAISTIGVASAPIYFILTLILLPIMGFISFFFNYLFSAMVSPSVLNSTIVRFPLTILVCTNLHWVMLALIIIGSIGLYAKREKGQYIE